MPKINNLNQYKKRKRYLRKISTIKKNDIRVIKKGWTITEAISNKDWNFAWYLERVAKRNNLSLS